MNSGLLALLAALLLLLGSAHGQAQCTDTQVTCTNTLVTNPLPCASDPSQCPKRAVCSTSALPYRCADDLCAAKPQDCTQRLGPIVKCAQITCWDGSCQANSNDCPVIPACPSVGDQRCPDMTCQQNCASSPPLATACAIYAPPAGVTPPLYCCTSRPGYLCFKFAGCFIGDVRCGDGSCASNVTNCLVGPNTNAGGTASNTCTPGQVRCMGYGRFGTCNATTVGCPIAPSTREITWFAGAIGTAVRNYTISSLSTLENFGTVSFPAFLSSSNPASTPMNIFVDQQLEGSTLYPFTPQPSVLQPLNITGIGDPRSWQMDPTQGRTDVPTLTIYSAVVRAYSPQLNVLLQPPTTPPAGVALTTAKQLIDAQYVVTWELVATIPPDVGDQFICLAELLNETQAPFTGRVNWRCVDDNPVLVNTNPPTYRAFSPLVDLAVGNPKIHYAIIADYFRIPNYGKVETVQGGLVALAVIVFIVLLTVILANREKIWAFITSKIFRSGESA